MGDLIEVEPISMSLLVEARKLILKLFQPLYCPDSAWKYTPLWLVLGFETLISREGDDADWISLRPTHENRITDGNIRSRREGLLELIIVNEILCIPCIFIILGIEANGICIDGLVPEYILGCLLASRGQSAVRQDTINAAIRAKVSDVFIKY